MSATIDTLALAKRLQNNGFTREQAEGLVEALFDQPAPLLTVPVLDQRLAALNLDARFRDLEQRLTIKMGTMVLVVIGALSTVSILVHFWK
jgi:hypothetical protein